MIFFFEFAKHYIWRCLWTIFVLMRGTIWWMRGISQHLAKAQSLEFQGKPVHVRKIMSRFNIDPIALPSTEKMFLTVHESFQDLNYVLKENVILMYVTENEAMFVEIDPKQDFFNNDYNSFFAITVYRLAVKFITMPRQWFDELGDSLPEVRQKVLFVSNTTRCGSTLMCQILQNTGRCLTWAEPDPINCIGILQNKVREATLDRIARNIVKVMCKPISKQIDAVVFKMPGPSMPVVRRLCKLFPEAKQLFMYRDGLANIKSFNKLIQALPIANLIAESGKISGSMAAFVMRMAGRPDDFFNVQWKSHSHFSAVMWASGIIQYLTFRKEGIPISSLKYEDIVDDPISSFNEIYDYLGLDYTDTIKQSVLETMGKDSQRQSPLNREACRKLRTETIDDKILAQINQVCVEFGLPQVNQPFTLVGTITSKTKDFFGDDVTTAL